MGQTDRYITGRYTIDQGGSISASSLNEGEDIPLFVTKGKIEVVNSQGKRYVVNEGENVILAASGGAYELFGLEGPAEVFTQDVPNRRDAESLEMTASEIAAVENKETGQIKYLANTLASKEMKSLITSLDVDDGVIINAFDTTVEDALRGTVQAAQSLINQEAGNRIINIRGTGSALLQAIQKAMTDNQGKVRAVVTTTPDQKIAAAATQYGSVINVEQMRDGRGRYMPVPGLQDLALRIAVANVLYKDGATGGYTRDGARFVFWALDRVALAPDNKPFTIDDVIELLKRGFFRILPRIVPVDLAAASAAYRAAQAALKSL
ncbi:MAG: hypothetical protein NTZ95_02250 [Candidatus Omnitrophica bacterium]|nr:hypothetical protein [Candidatus Omnitrophota bacterium]